jgi:hypothetical protein
MNMEGNEFFKKKSSALNRLLQNILRSRCVILMFHFAANQIPVQSVAKNARITGDYTI